MVVARGCRWEAWGSKCLIGTEFWFLEDEKILKMDSSDGNTKM
jgi:hypothetical protein